MTRNPASPLLPSAEAAVEKLWAVPAEKDHRDVWEGPVRVGQYDGIIYVLDRMASKIYLVSRDGQWVGTWGRKGSGPGEFVEPYAIGFIGDSVLVADGGKASVEILDKSGTSSRTLRLNAVGFDMRTIEPAAVLVNTFDGRSGGWRIYSLDGTVGSFDPPPSGPSPGTESDGCWRTGTAGQLAVQLDCTRPVLRELDLTGRIRRVVEIDRGQREASADELRAVERDMKAKLSQVGLPPAQAQSVLERSLETVRVKRIMRDVRYDRPAGMFILWEQEPDELGGGNAVLHLLSRSGVYLAEVPLPAPLVDFDSDGLIIYALEVQSGTGLVSLAAYRIRLPEAIQQFAEE